MDSKFVILQCIKHRKYIVVYDYSNVNDLYSVRVVVSYDESECLVFFYRVRRQEVNTLQFLLSIGLLERLLQTTAQRIHAKNCGLKQNIGNLATVIHILAIESRWRTRSGGNTKLLQRLVQTLIICIYPTQATR